MLLNDLQSLGARLGAFGVAIGVCLAVAPVDAQAQAPWPEPGSRVRVTRACDADLLRTARSQSSRCAVVGEFVRAQAGLLMMNVADSTAGFAVTGINRFEVSRGVKSHRLVGALAGLAIGTGITYIVLHQGGSTSKCDRSANQDAMSATECLGLTAAGGLVGAGLGAVAGGFVRTERWQEIPLERLRVGLTRAGSTAITVFVIL